MMSPRTPRISLEEEKNALLGRFVEVRGLIFDVAARIEPGQVGQPFVGSWDILDLLAHLCGWDAVNLQSARDIFMGKLPEFYAKYDKDWVSYNAQLVARYRCKTLIEMIHVTRKSHTVLLNFLEGLSPEQLLRDQGVRHGNYKVIINRLITAETRDEQKHLEQIRSFIK